jgi:zinc transport system substrate-binding protein
LGALALLASACTSQQSPQTQAAPASNTWANDGKVHVAATFYPMADFADKVGGDRVQVICLVPAGTEPHDWEPSPDDIITIQTADLVVSNGLGIDAWLDDVLSSLGSEAPAHVCTSDGITPLKTDHGTDPHLWLNPANARLQAQAIAEALTRVDADGGHVYQDNLADFGLKLQDLDYDYQTGLATCARHEIVVSHEAYGYLCQAYHLEQIGIEGLSPDSEPDAARMAQIVDLVRDKGITTIFFEELVSPKVAQAIASETGTEAVELSPLEGLTEEDQAAGEEYVSVMRDNLAKLQKALS